MPARHFAGAEGDRVHDSGRRGPGTPLSSVRVCLTPSKQRSTLRTEGESLREKNGACTKCDEIVFNIWLDLTQCDISTILVRVKDGLRTSLTDSSECPESF